MSEATRLIEAMSKGEPQAAAELLPLIYHELRKLARSHMLRERSDHTLQATALVHEAYLRLVQHQPSTWQGRRHFFAAAAEAMRRILIEHARRKKTVKHGGDHCRVELEEEDPEIGCSPSQDLDELLALNEALDRLGREDPARAELVKLIYFAGLNLDEAAASLGITRSAAYRQWIFAKAWLHEAITGRSAGPLPTAAPKTLRTARRDTGE